MREVKMAELQFEAPLARFDGEEWNDYNEFQTASDIENSNRPLAGPMAFKKRDGTSAVDNFSETFSDSLEDLVNTFDEKITKCFCNFDEKVEKFAPVQVRSQEEIMKDCQMWWTITGNYGNILPIDWSKSYTQQLQEKSLKLGEKRERDSSDLDLSDDEELTQAFDIHSLIISSLQQEPMFNADEVIDEIEGMMEDSDDDEHSLPSCDMLSCDMMPTPTGSDIVNTATASILQSRENSQATTTNLEESLNELSVCALNELYDELEHTFRENSEVLITSLALRDELEYEKELKNQFISLLLSVQKKRQMNKKRCGSNSMKKPKSALGAEPGTYLTTVIPYHPSQGPPTTEQLQIYIKILTAVNEDSATVPGLLTDYILKVLCPTI